MKVVIVVGHSKHSVGACSKNFNVCEYQWNAEFAEDLAKLLNTECVVIHRDTLMTLPSIVNQEKPDFIVALHCNAYNTAVGGCETLYWHKSKSGKVAAAILQEKITFALYNKNRGIKPKTSEDRGGFLLRYTNAPCLIAEPFFIDNDIDFANAQMHRDSLLFAFKEAIEETINYLKEKRCKKSQ